MNRILASLAIFTIAASLAGCTTSQRQDVGIATGAVVGGVAGHALTGGSTAGTIIGAGGGALVGSALSK